MEERYVASVSWGKDSLAMLWLLLGKNYPLHEVVFYDTGMEFQAIYDTRDKMVPLLEHFGITYTELKPKRPFLYDMFEKPKKGRRERLRMVRRPLPLGNYVQDRGHRCLCETV